MIDYSAYKLSAKQYISALVLACSLFFLIGYIFFKSVLIATFLACCGVLYPRIRRQNLLHHRRNELTAQFKQALYMIASALAAGQSIESALMQTAIDLQQLYPDERAYIRVEFHALSKLLNNGESVENALRQLSERAGIEDIANFTNVFIICKRTGGNLVEVMRNTANMIGEKIAIQQDIAVMIAQKKFESKVLTIAPLLFIGLLSWSSADYMAPLYEGRGYVIMGCALLLLVCCYLLSKKIMNIKV